MSERLPLGHERPMPALTGLVERAPDILYRYVLRPEPAFEYVSPASTEITGYTPEDHYEDADLLHKMVHPDDRGRLEAWFAAPDARPLRLRLVRRDGHTILT